MATLGEFYILNEKLTKMRIVADKNISAPSPITLRRSSLETAQILEQYTSGKIDLYKVFPEVVIDQNLPTPIKQAYLANYAWGLSPAHKLFAERLYSDLFTKTADRDLITSHFGPKIYREFLEKRSKIELVTHA
jgi:hypothetical protein